MVHKALVARNKTAVMYYGLTGTLTFEVDALPGDLQAIRAPEYHKSGTFTRLFFQEPCLKPSSTCAAEKPKWYQTAKGPEAHWGILHLLRVVIGVPPATPAPYAVTGVNKGTGPCSNGQTIGTSRCVANAKNFVPSAAYPFRSPLVVVDYLVDSLRSAGPGSSQTLAVLGRKDRDLVDCLSESTVRAVHIRSRNATTTRIASSATAWYWQGSVARKRAQSRVRRNKRESVSPSEMLATSLHRELRSRGQRGSVFIGLDGYSIADMQELPKLLHELNTSFGVTASLIRLPFDESPDFGTASAQRRRSMAEETSPAPNGLMNARIGPCATCGHGRLSTWRRWGVWHVIRVEVGST